MPEKTTSIPSETKREDILDIFLVFKMTAPWDVQTQYALNSDHFLVTARTKDSDKR